MQQIHKLQDFLKGKKKIANPKYIIQAINQIQDTEKAIKITLTQKGIILELLAKVYYQQYTIFAKGLFLYYDSLKNGSFGVDKQKTTIKKKKGNAQRGNTTTAKRKKIQNPEKARNVMNLDQILQKQLSTPNNTEIKSQHTDQFSKQKQRIQLPLIQILAPPNWQSQQYMTPLKQEQIQQEKQMNLDKYRSIINVQSKKKTRTAKTRKQEQTTKTRKKLKGTQPIQQQIDGQISLEHTSQISLRVQIQNILEATKKKKNKDKQNLHNHQLFKMQLEDNKQILQKRQNIKKFYLQNYDKYKRGTTAYENYGYSQHTNHFNFIQELQNENKQNYENLVFNKRSEQIMNVLDQQIKDNRQAQFSFISDKFELKKESKASFFYDLLCFSEKYNLSQPQIGKFGQISISFLKDKIF